MIVMVMLDNDGDNLEDDPTAMIARVSWACPLNQLITKDSAVKPQLFQNSKVSAHATWDHPHRQCGT